MFVGGVVHDASTYEGLAAKAHALHSQMDAAEKSNAPSSYDVLTHMQMRQLRREAQATLYALETASAMTSRASYPEIIISTPKRSTAADGAHAVALERKNAKDVFDGLTALYKKSIFVKDRGRLIYQKRPKDLPVAVKIAEQSKDLFAKTVAYGRKRPIQFAAISLSVLAAKILFVLFVWNALVDGSRKVLGLKEKSKASHEANQSPANAAPPTSLHGATAASSS